MVPGTAMFLTSDASSAPTALLHSLKHYKVLHERNVILTVNTTGIPYVPRNQRLKFEQLSERSCASRQASATWKCRMCRKPFRPPRASLRTEDTSYFLSRRNVGVEVPGHAVLAGQAVHSHGAERQ